MTITEKAKEKLDEATKEIKAGVDGLAVEVAGLSERVKQKLKGNGDEMKEVSEILTREVKELSEKVKQLIPKRRQKHRLPVRRVKEQDYYSEKADFPLAGFRREFNHLLNDFFSRFEFPSNTREGYSLSTWDAFSPRWPQMDVKETDDDILITAELPGVDKEDIEISIDQNRITIRGEKKTETEKKGHNYYHMERHYGAFHRSIPLPWEVKSDKVDAEFNSGVLTVSLPKSAAARERMRKIPVREE